jgi:hypothetical protein
MNHSSIHRLILASACCILTALLLSGCGSAEKSGGGSQKSEAKEAHDNHGAVASGATYQEGQGVALLEETSRSLGLELAEVAEHSVWPGIPLTAQIYRAASEVSRTYGKERQGNAYATALISPELASQLKMGQKLTFVTKNGTKAAREGIIWKIDTVQTSVLGRAEALLELPDANLSLAVGAFVEAQALVGVAPQKLTSIPKSAVLETSMGKYAFVKNGRHLLRTEIKTGGQNNNYIEVTEGLYEGDTIVVKPVEALYMIELRETKGGGHCH